MKFRFSQTPWDGDSWFHGGDLADGVLTISPETAAAVTSGTAWGHCVRSMVDAIVDGEKNIGPQVVLEGSPWWCW